jgi:DNA-binding response OmpR family regulator
MEKLVEQNDKKILLLVEDEFLIAAVKKQELEKYGYRVLSTNTGEKAISIVKEN